MMKGKRGLVGIALVLGLGGCGDEVTPSGEDGGSSTGSTSETTPPDTSPPQTGSTTGTPDESSSGAGSTTEEPDPDTTTTDPATGTDASSSSGSTSTGGDDPTGSSSSSGSTGGTTEAFASEDSSGSSGFAEFCGNGAIEGDEECDDAGLNGPQADCTPDCTTNVCGDGFAHAFAEECDDGDGNDAGADCTPQCLTNVCGDGFTHAFNEVCDDGNGIGTDSCVGCQTAVCGDGFVLAGGEACDDGNDDDLDACHDDCSTHAVIELALSANHTCALFDSGNVMCWGSGASGRTGHGNQDNIGDDEPAYAAGFLDLGGPVESVVAGGSHSCVSQESGEVRCFGAAGVGQLGRGTPIAIGDNETPGSAPGLTFAATPRRVATDGGALHSCASFDGDITKCWGQYTSGQLGVPGQAEPIGDNETVASAPAVNVGDGVAAFAMGAVHTCALLDGVAGQVTCWGSGANGALGYGNVDTIGDDEDPVDAGTVRVGAVVQAIAAGWYHTCALLDEGAVRCWGRGNDGRLGYGNTAYVGAFNEPDDVGDVQVGAPVAEITAGLGHTCVRTPTNEVRCWGYNGFGQLGYGNTDSIGDNEHPVVAGVVDVGAPVVQIAADGNHTCAITDTGNVRCWGAAGEGRLGYGDLEDIGDDESPAMARDVPLFSPIGGF